MRIAIDCRPLIGAVNGPMAGIGRYTHALVRALLRLDEENQYVLFFDGRASKNVIAEIIGGHRHAEPRILPFSRFKRFFPYAYSHRFVASAIARCGADLYHSTTGSLPLGYGGKSVITVHDLAIYAHPEWFPGRQFFSRRFVVPASIARASRVIAVSQATKRDVQRLFAVPTERISVIYEGVEPPPSDARARAPLLAEPYALFLGTIEPRKNIERLLRAYVSLVEHHPAAVGSARLVLAGGRGWKAEGVLAEIARANRAFGEERIRLLGYVSESDRVSLMAHAAFFAFPSLYEGFGLPVLEAMRFGLPVITSTAGALPEIAGRGAAWLVDPENQAELVSAMKHLFEDGTRRAELGRRAFERSLEFSWERAAGETLEVYEKVARMQP